MAIETTVIGSYPKSPNEGEPFALRQTLHRAERGEATPDDVRTAQDRLVREVIAEQEAASIGIVSDGQVRWDDILSPFARNMSGLEVGGLLRWFDNNVYYRRPVCTGAIEWRGPTSIDDFRFAKSVASAGVKAVIPGPITFARLSLDEHYGSHEKFVVALARVLAQEAFELEAAGARFIQIDEPALLDAPEDLALAQRALGVVTADVTSAETIVATYFADAKRLGAGLFDLPVDCFGLDLVAGPANRELVSEIPNGKILQAGITDARNTKLESEDELRKTVVELVDQLGEERVRLSPSAGLEFLPREKARAKLKQLGDVAKKVGGLS